MIYTIIYILDEIKELDNLYFKFNNSHLMILTTNLYFDRTLFSFSNVQVILPLLKILFDIKM